MRKNNRKRRLARTSGVAGRGKPQLRPSRVDGWTDERRQVFLETLAETCNVTASIEQAGMKSKSGLYQLRQRDPEFRELWEQALLQGYAELEFALLQRSIHGVPKPVFHSGKRIAEVRTFNDGAALSLLKKHGESVARIKAREAARDPDAIYDELTYRLAEIRVRMRRAGELVE